MYMEQHKDEIRLPIQEIRHTKIPPVVPVCEHAPHLFDDFLFENDDFLFIYVHSL